MTIHELLQAAGLTANDEIPIWDADGTGEPTKKITAQQLAAAVTTLANLVTSVNNQTGAVSITPANIGAVAKTGDTMTGPLTTDSDIIQTNGYLKGSVNDGINHAIKLGHAGDNVMEFNEYGGLYNFYRNASDLRELIFQINGSQGASAAPLPVTSGGTGATTWNGARENLGVIARQEGVPFDSNGVGTINTPNGFTPFAAVLDQNWFVTVYPPNTVMAHSVSDYNTLIRDTTTPVNVLYAKLA